ncbi:MAG: RecQ family ATP-dependent DNA helicase [candidate division KSB1 bacterium]|nr:RecQ family ATP-dependent DNA helicase [candidate division KSB1 bacterium]MDZ7317634.1 RecQ family ATP-dependent DNA helicase [candidate division KSB1 bacterium]MDZ7341669.1 RecQ family ATP-dependent DNA helicase [candidate division KSB1 bacterium]
MMTPDALVAILQQRFQLSSFRPGQLEVIQSLLHREDVLCVMPTGYGKSLCYQLTALLLDGITVVVSPLVALMKDQVDSLGAKGFSEATFINSSLSVDEQQQRLQRLNEGHFKLVYISPERFRSRAFLYALNRLPISLFVIDEAHCISQWGHDFRPDYLALDTAIDALGRPQVAAFTATATAEVRADIKRALARPQFREFVYSIGRANLEFFVFPISGEEDKLLWVKHLVTSIRGKGIVYAGKRRDCEQINAFLSSMGLKSEYFHAGREESQKKTIQERFMNDNHPAALDVIVATNAFGLGVDKANIRFVVHSAIPGTVEEYFQEAGRAGRDEKRSFCILLYSYDDRSLQEWFIENSLVDREQLIYLYQRLDAFPAVDQYRIVAYDELLWNLKLNETKIRVAISHLERLGLIQRLPDVDLQATIYLTAPADSAPELVDLLENSDKGKRRMLQAILEHARDEHSLELVSFCKQHHFAPLSVVNMLYDLEFEQKITFRHGKRAMLLKIIKPLAHLKKLPAGELGLEEYRDHRYRKLEQMLHYAESSDCRVRFIRRYFGEQVSEDCGRCDNCRQRKAQPQPKDKAAASSPSTQTKAAAQGTNFFDPDFLNAALLLTIREAKGYAGKNMIADILKGSKAKSIIECRYDKLSTYGKLSFFRKEALVEAIKTLILKGWVLEKRSAEFNFPTVSLSAKGLAKVTAWEQEHRRFAWPTLPETLSEQAEIIFQRLKRLRLQVADREGLLPFQVFHDRTLRELAITQPQTLEQLAFVRGLGDLKIEKYGPEIVRAVAGFHAATARTQGRFSEQDVVAVKRFLQGKLSHILPGSFDLGYALDNHTIISEGNRQYTRLGRMVYEFKYQGQKSHLDGLVTEMVKFLDENEDYRNIDFVIPVPSTQTGRNYDPVLMLARELSRRAAIPLNENCLTKTRKTQPQKEQVNKTQKQLNVKDAFRVNDSLALKGKTALLLDDLYDSGATLDECTRVLREAGVRKVLALTLTRTMHGT